jgi:tetratricopeptide (TPR) repeat protein
MDVSLQPEKSFLHARAAVTLRAGQYLEAVEFELNPDLSILEVTDAAGRKLEFARSGRLGSPKLSVRLAEPCGAEQGVTLTFVYEGALPHGPLDYITKDGILLRDESRWYPAVDLSAFTANRMTLTVPAGWMAITSGERAKVRSSEGSATYRWKTSNPVSSRSIVAIPQDLERCSLVSVSGTGGDGIRLANCLPGTDETRSRQLAGEVGTIASYYRTILHTDATFKLTVVQGFPGQRGAVGYSAPGFLVVSEDFLKFHDDPDYAPEFLPHEIAHQWFPIEVTLARQEDGWLAESLAEYLAWRYLREREPEQARRMAVRAMRDALAPEPLRPLSLGLRLFALEDWDVTQATLYQRGLLVWRTLETVIDRERVDKALAEYFKRYAGRSASIPDFRRICEEISGRDLGWFFDYFIRGTRIPEVEFRRTPSSAPGETSGEIILKDVAPEFQVRVEMRLETTAGAAGHSVATRGLVTPFTVTTPQPVTRITLDPESRILRWTEAARRNRSQRTLLRQLGELERERQFARAAEYCRQALALDPENLASNQQQIRFALGRLYDRMNLPERALQEFARVLALDSLDPMESDFNRAWSRVYRARIERRRGRVAAARAEARAGLEMKSPALSTPVAWPEAPGKPSTAAEALQALAR